MLRPLNFKTSYVIVYLKEVDRSQKRYIDFKTSHVIVYQAQKALWIICHKISKHLMLLFIFSTPDIDIWSPGFQNISCYCLSITVGIMLIGSIIFQNISCYCLSLAFPRFLVSPLPFFPLYFLYFSIFYQPTPLSWTALLIIP